MKFLIINRPPVHKTKEAAVGLCVDHFVNLDASGRAKVYPIAGLKGYATFVDAKSDAELQEILAGNAMGNIEEYKVIALADLRD